MLLLLVSLIHINQASSASANTRNLFLGFNSHHTLQHIDWREIQHYYQLLELKYFKCLLYLSFPCIIIDIFTLVKFHNAWLILAELVIYLLSLTLISKKVKRHINQIDE
ncbi:hypothetical protein CNQ82_00845 [Staphylococcus debuckii]|nr:hypothetical protein CNQ82_00845 [Staphylococcus debuckii]